MDITNNSNNTVWQRSLVTREKRERQGKHKSVVIWFTGLSGSGKSTIAHLVEEKLFLQGCRTFVFDGDNVRHGLCSDLGFLDTDRSENIRRIGEMVKLFTEAGMISITAFISPFRKDRQKVKILVGEENFIEIYCSCSLDECQKRDVKGLYRRAKAGNIKNFTGISSPYEVPEKPDLVLNTDLSAKDECVKSVIDLLIEKKILLKK